MKSILAIIRSSSLLALVFLALGQLAQAQTPVLQLQATNYNPNTGIWTATIGSNATNAPGASTLPVLTTGATPNGSPAVVFNGANFLTLASSIAGVNGYTAIAYIKPSTTSGTLALFGGAAGSFEYRLNVGHQDALRQNQQDLNSGTAVLSTSAFSIVAVTVTNVGGGSYRLNGVADGSSAAITTPFITQPISAIGAKASGTGQENFNGAITEIDIYAGVLSAAQIATVELAISNSYITSVLGTPRALVQPFASPTTATVGGNDTLTAYFNGTLPIGYQWQSSANVGFSPATSITAATNTTLTLTNLQLSDSGKYYRIIGTNTYSPYNFTSAPVQLTVAALTPMVQLIASNYDGSSVWTDSSGNGNNATYSGATAPTLATFATPNGGSAVSITAGSGSFVLTSSLAQGSGYTVFAYGKPTNKTGAQAITGGSSSGALEYSVKNGKQHYAVEYVNDIADGVTNVSTNSFSILNLAVNSSAGAFRYNGTNDGANVAGSTFTSPITRIGNNEGGGDGYVGQLAEVDIYSGVLTFTQITNIEAQLTAKYITANSLTIGPSTVSPTNNTFAGNPITLAASVLGGTGTTTYQWQTDSGTSGASYSNIGGATTTNYVLSTTGLNGTYQYRLIGTPFGGIKVTNTYVSLTVNPQSAPIVVADTTINLDPATVGGNATLSASFVGNLPIGYQWQVSANASGVPATSIAGATNATYTLSNLQLSDSGNYYSLRASNSIAPNVVNSTWTQLTVNPLTAAVQFIATNYDTNSGTWTDTSGNGDNATYAGGTLPTIDAFITPNGSSAVNFASGGGRFNLSSSLDPSSGYTVFAYVKPSNKSAAQAITGGSSPGALEYSIKNGKQHYTVEYLADIGDGATNVSTNSFSIIDLAVNSSGGAFRYNGTNDGANVAGSTFSSPITKIGNNEGYGDGFIGDIAEIDIYTGVLSYLQITNIEAQLNAKYVTANTIVIGAATVSPTNNTYAGSLITLAAPVIGGTGTTTYQWQTDNASGGASYSNIGGATTTNYVFDTTGLNGTYLLQLVGTPFGGSSVTSAPVTLSVQPASAPVVVADTAANPSTATVGGNDTLTASFTGTLPIRYQWQVSPNSDGSVATSLTGQTNTTLVLSNLQLSDSGKYYSLQASNAIAPNIVNSTWQQLNVVPLTALVQLIATNYDPTIGVWTNSADGANNATYTNGLKPTLDSAVTPNGSSAVNLTSSGGSFELVSPLDPSSGYTVIAYVKPASTSGRNALTGGSASDALEYDIYNGNQNYLREYLQDVGNGTATIPTSSFSLISLAVNSSGAAFRYNGASDGNVAGATFTTGITRIGNNHGTGDTYTGDIAEIDIYSGVLNSTQITNLEAQFTAKYVTAGVPPAVTGLKFTAAPVVSGTGLTISATNTGAGTIYLLTTTNVATPINSWSPIWTNVLSGSGSFTTNLSGVINPDSKQQFYILSNTNK